MNSAELSPRPGRFREWSVDHYAVDALWTFDAGARSGGIVPADGCFDLIVFQDTVTRRARAVINAPRPSAQLTLIPSGVGVFGIRLTPGFGPLLTETANAVVSQVLNVVTQGGGVTEASAIVRAWAESHRGPPSVVRSFVAEVLSAQGGVRLTRRTSAGARELQRACKHWLNLTPKQFLRIARARCAATSIGAGIPLAAAAATHSYADQSHLTRELHLLLGVTPGSLRPVANLQDSTSRSR